MPTWWEAVGAFIVGNTLWFSRQWLWQQWVKRSHRDIIVLNREEEEKTREEIRRLERKIKEYIDGSVG